VAGIASGSKLPDILTVQVWMKPPYDDAMADIDVDYP
jgi:hypothetical protein